ncbi:MAG: isoprenoid synthase domain-containing protein [Monoraphidium minutum]|nr:MAG: isoprenoid synthase domain-containing protein [Monoraphidium minutum]
MSLAAPCSARTAAQAHHAAGRGAPALPRPAAPAARRRSAAAAAATAVAAPPAPAPAVSVVPRTAASTAPVAFPRLAVVLAPRSPRSAPPPPPRPAFDFGSYMEQRAAFIDAAVLAAAPELSARELPQQAPGLRRAMRHGLVGGGGRGRGVMCLAACELLGGSPEWALATAAAIEMAGASSQMHDDLMASPLGNHAARGGRPACHEAFGAAAAVLAGGALLVDAILTVVRGTPHAVTSARVNRAVTALAAAAGSGGLQGEAAAAAAGAGAGGAAGATDVAAALCGGHLAGGSGRDLVRLREYARCVGAVRQIVAAAAAAAASDADDLFEALGRNRARGGSGPDPQTAAASDANEFFEGLGRRRSRKGASSSAGAICQITAAAAADAASDADDLFEGLGRNRGGPARQIAAAAAAAAASDADDLFEELGRNRGRGTKAAVPSSRAAFAPCAGAGAGLETADALTARAKAQLSGYPADRAAPLLALADFVRGGGAARPAPAPRSFDCGALPRAR